MSPQVTAVSSQHVSLLIMLGKSHNIFILIHHTGSESKKAQNYKNLDIINNNNVHNKVEKIWTQVDTF